MTIVAIFILYLVIAYFIMGISEYLIHKFFMHRRFFTLQKLKWIWYNHSISHHKHSDYTHNIDLPIWYHLILSLPIIIGLAYYSLPGLLAWLIVIFYHSWLWTHAHRAIHGLEHNWLEKTMFYHQIRIHHELHHDHPNKNYGVCFFFMDRIFGTKI